MTTSKGYELGSTIHDRMDSIRMTPAEREAAMAAMRQAFAIVDACLWIVARIRQLGASRPHRQTVAH